jgi:hypothetical protein
LYASALASPGEPPLAEAAAIIDRLPAPMAAMRTVVMVRNLIAQERKRR